MAKAPYPKIEIDSIEMTRFSAETGSVGGLGNVVYYLSFANSRKVQLAFLNNSNGFSISPGSEFMTINAGIESIGMVTAMDLLLRQNGTFTIRFSGTPKVTMTFE